MGLAIANLPEMSQLFNTVRRGTTKMFLKGVGWYFLAPPADLPRYVMIGAPHTSWFDFPMLMSALALYDLPLEWMAKESMFRPPFGRLMRAMGGIPVDRSRRHNAVAQAVELFNARERLVLAIAPEGTRKRTEGWKTGFWHIANLAGVPIIPAYLDGKRREAGFGPPIQPSGDIDADFRRLAEFYARITPIVPERFGPVQPRPGADAATTVRAASPSSEGLG
ncbi:MAG: acyltransferase [Proteobacteria bacterium]|nr:acyltransferase [Pseudomonadota bacterium]